MKKVIIYLGIATVFFLSACQKDYNPIEDQPGATNESIEDLDISDSFKWKMSQEIKLEINSNQDVVAEVKSKDGSIVYHKARITAGETYVAEFTVPNFVEEIVVNDQIVRLDNTYVTVNLSENKSSKALTATTIYSLYFDGSNDYVAIADADLVGAMPAASSGAPEDFTISSWIYLKSTSDRKPIASKQGTSVGGNNRGFLFSATNGGLEFEVFKNNSDDTDLVSATGLMSTNTWYHVAATYEFVADGSSEMNLYIDGVNVASSSSAIGPIQPNPQPFDVGRYYYSSGYQRYFHGYMDDFRVYSYARTAAEIATDMFGAPSGSETDLELSWLFEEGSGTTAQDGTSNSNDGTISGAVYSSTTVPYTFTDSDGDGVADDDDDYPNDGTRAFDNFFPAAGFGSIAYEDLWPGKGDYDFNDVVVDYRFHTITNASNEVVEIIGTFLAKASGAIYENGFGFNLPDASAAFTGNPQKISVSGYDIQEAYITLNGYGHEDGQTKPTIIVFDNFFNLLPNPGSGIGVNTDPNQIFVSYETVTITIIPNEVLTMADFSLNTWNPFIIVDGVRGHEVHLPDYEPTDLFDASYLGQWEDDSDPSLDRYFKTVTNLPWALDIPAEFAWPIEKNEITTAYLHFAEWAESGGTLYNDWYTNTGAGYRDESKIYAP